MELSWIIEGLLTLIIAIVGYLIKGIISTQKEHEKRISENESKWQVNTNTDKLMNSQITQSITDLKTAVLETKKDIIERIDRSENVMTSRLNSHSDQIKDIDKRVTKLESK